MGGLFSEKAWAVVLAHKANFIQGFSVTVESAIGGILIATVLGILLGLMGVSSKRLPHAINRIYVEAIQNTPLILQLCLLYYACPSPVTRSGSCSRDRFPGAVPWSLYGGSDPGGHRSVPRGQFEAADARDSITPRKWHTSSCPRR